MKWIYRVGIFFARMLLLLGALFIPKIRHFTSSRKNLFQSLKAFRVKYPGSLAWFHVASLGEYEQARPVIAELKRENPAKLIAVSFFSPSGYDHAIKKPQAQVDFITYLPLDSKHQAEEFVRTLNPDLVFFVKYDLWYHHIMAVKARNTLLFLFSAAFRPDQIYFKRDGFFRQIVFQFDYIFTQNQPTVDLLKSINYQQTCVAGDTRFDRVAETANNFKEFPALAKWVGEKPTLVAGSVWQEDMELLIPVMNANPEYRWIIAPHDISPEPMMRWSDLLELKSSRYSQWDSDLSPDVIFIDNIGMLSSLYQFAKVAYVGGGLGKGLHNILEPLGFGIPVIFGKLEKTAKFPEAAESQKNGCGFEVSDEANLKLIFEKLEHPDFYYKSAEAAKTWVNMNIGAAERIVNKVEELVSNSRKWPKA
ncbi:3-deoxy-D-manno-octulosonic-acid transferase [Algoriphagus ratkowskyi]|uniref:3-deoxy-D-manno-octulosonic acid transferase n=1 Tax=Algoriphagus ratkowskyi TaxID=57028 RepID=A0A2W7RIL4_9BACT|nr:glycosyltransferase N-terminal domain-containing protein [Algoriphagus ratkowskyi]PZX60234.1 3-deoxy-D-manno-octulosonic-acid transferase [Algoriphagus ratkowskyi]TXD78058.1 3-deoxy-D-manno-octulosonic acid transferase [Algoriphagus ratkowskyi]